MGNVISLDERRERKRNKRMNEVLGRFIVKGVDENLERALIRKMNEVMRKDLGKD